MEKSEGKTRINERNQKEFFDEVFEFLVKDIDLILKIVRSKRAGLDIETYIDDYFSKKERRRRWKQ